MSKKLQILLVLVVALCLIAADQVESKKGKKKKPSAKDGEKKCAWFNGTYIIDQDVASCKPPCKILEGDQADHCKKQAKKECLLDCKPMGWHPVCSNQAVTYSNMCEFFRDSHCYLGRIRLAHRGVCNGDETKTTIKPYLTARPDQGRVTWPPNYDKKRLEPQNSWPYAYARPTKKYKH